MAREGRGAQIREARENTASGNSEHSGSYSAK